VFFVAFTHFRYREGATKTFALCGFVRAHGESDDSINRLAQNEGILSKYECGA
jgi:hypothetical protein